MMVSPYVDQASSMNAEMVNLQSEKELDSFTRNMASGKTTRKSSKQQTNIKGSGVSETMEIRSRFIRTGELVYNPYFIAFETTFNFALAFLIGLALRWMFGLIRSLRLSSPVNGYCCSPYRGGDDDASRLPGAFEKLLACVLVKGNGDDAFKNFIFTGLLMLMLSGTIRLAVSVSSPYKGDLESDLQSEETKTDGGEKVIKRIHPTKAKRFITFASVASASLWIFNTPALLRLLGLDGLIAATEECGARILLFCIILGVIDLPDNDTILSNELPEVLQIIMNALFLLLALAYGYIASSLIVPINETARNTAYILSSSMTKKRTDPSEMLQMMNTRMMLFIQGIAPLVIMITYLFHAKFAEAEKLKVRKNSFSAHYLQNSGLFLRVALSWCFVGASIYTFRSILQSYLDQAATVASATAALGLGSDKKAGKRPSPYAPPKVDPFSDRYNKVVYSAARIAVFPLFIFTLLVISHLYGGNGEPHPGIGHQNAHRSVLSPKGLLPPFAGDYMSWIDRKRLGNTGEMQMVDILLEAAAMSESSWYATPFRDFAHNKLVDILGSNNVCRAPEFRTVNALSRHVKYLLEIDNSTENAMTGRELLSLPVLGKTITSSCDASIENEDDEVCKEDAPPWRLVISSLFSHNILTPTVVFPIIDTVAFLSSAWWTYWFTVKTIFYSIKLKGAAGSLKIT